MWVAALPSEQSRENSRREADMFSELQPFRTVWDPSGDLPALHASEIEALKPGGKWAELLPSIPEGENYLWHTERKGGLPLFGWRTRYWSFLLKLSKRLPSWTVQAQPRAAIGPFHWDVESWHSMSFAVFKHFPMFGGGLWKNRDAANAWQCGPFARRRSVGS